MKLVSTMLSTCISIGAISSPAMAETFEVTITNATAGQVLTPPVVITHSADVALFEIGQPAPGYLIPLAEDGDTSAFTGADALDEVSDVVMADGAVMPGRSVTLIVETTSTHPLLSLAGMFASTNDAFIAMNGQMLTFDPQPSMHYINVYDAGSEANSEDCQYIPGPPCGNGGVRDTQGAEGFVHIHRGIHGINDLSAPNYSWNNPGALVRIQMK